MAPTTDLRLTLRQRPNQPPVMRQRWSRLLFAHWPTDPAAIQATLPAGLHVDTFHGQAWIGIVPLYMERIRPVFAPPLPWLSWFLELNVRTYVHDDQGNAGVWFYSLDCNQPLAVEIARRAFHLPYQHARMSASREGDCMRYQCQRKGQPAISHYLYKPVGGLREAVPGSLEFFLIERYLLFSASADGRVHTGRVHHLPYLIADAVCDPPGLEPLHQAGLTVPAMAPESVLYSPGMDVTVFPLRRH